MADGGCLLNPLDGAGFQCGWMVLTLACSHLFEVS